MKMWMKHNRLNEHEQKLVDMSSDEFDAYMMEMYPNMFSRRHDEDVDSDGRRIMQPMNFGFQIGRGWRHVLDSACRKCKVIEETTGCTPVFDQIKEKFGSARFYHHVEDLRKIDVRRPVPRPEWLAIIDGIVNQAEEYTDYVCERLGTNVRAEDKVGTRGWVYGMSVDGYKLWAEETFSKEEAQRRIQSMEAVTKAKKERLDLKREIDYISSDEVLDYFETMKLVREKKDASKKNEAKKDTVE